MSDASRRWFLHKTWSMGVTVPSLVPLFWILMILAKLDRKITPSVHAKVFMVAGPFPVFNWSNPLRATSLRGPIFTIRRKATAPSAKSTRNSK